VIKFLVAVALAILSACSTSAPRSDTPTRLIVRWEAGQPPMTARLRELEQILGARVRYEREMSGDAHVLRLLEIMDDEALDAALQRLTALPHVRYAVRDERRMRH